MFKSRKLIKHENTTNNDIKRVEEFKYIGSYIGSTQHDVTIII